MTGARILIAGLSLALLANGCIVTSESLRQELVQIKESVRDNQAGLEKLAKENVNAEGRRNEGIKSEIMELRSMLARLNARVEEIGNDITLLKGSGEDSDYKIRRATEEVSLRIVPLEKKIQELYSICRDLSSRLDALQKAAAAPPPPPEKKEAADLTTDETGYKDAYEEYKKGNFNEAIEAFDSVLKKFPDSKLAGNCRYWQGESHYSLKQYREAIDRFGEVIEKYPKNQKAPAAYLKAAYSFIELGKTAEAKVFLKKLVEKFPKSEQAESARAKLKGLK